MSGSLLNRLQGYRVRDIAPKPPVAGKLTRVVGLTLEAIGCRAAIGALCRIDTQDGSLEAEVVGFSGDRLFLMPSEQLKGGHSRRPGGAHHRGARHPGRHEPAGPGHRRHRPAAGRARSHPLFPDGAICPAPHQSALSPPDPSTDGRGGACHQRRADCGPGPADGAVRRLRRRQIRAARHDDPRLGGRRGGGGAHRRTGPRGEGVHRGDPGGGGARTRRGGGGAGRCLAADAAQGV